jgi:hypothetical protein
LIVKKSLLLKNFFIFETLIYAMSKRLVTAALVFVILVASITANALPVNALPATSDLTKRSYYFLNDQHLTARFGNTAVCGDHLCGPGEFARLQQSLNDQQRFALEHTNQTSNQNMSENTMPPTTPPTTIPESMPQSTSMPAWITKASTVTSVQDPGQGHESHQLALILPPSDKIYTGVISWASSKPLQIVELTGPLNQGDDKGQPIWTTDGKTKFALTLVNVNATTGSFSFTGNALALHYPKPDAFTVSYSVSYMESSTTDTAKSGTLTSVQDPGQGHESHQLALILPPSDKAYHGVLTYSASEPVQLVTLIGPIDPNDKKGQLVYTMDGNTWYALVFVDSGMQMGTWEFSGNALAVHTTNTTPFQVSYTVDAHN